MMSQNRACDVCYRTGTDANGEHVAVLPARRGESATMLAHPDCHRWAMSSARAAVPSEFGEVWS